MINTETMNTFAELTTLKIAFDFQASIISNELGKIEQDMQLDKVEAASVEIKDTLSRLDEIIAKNDALIASYAPKKKWYQKLFVWG